jgi:hypothetical protein
VHPSSRRLGPVGMANEHSTTAALTSGDSAIGSPGSSGSTNFPPGNSGDAPGTIGCRPHGSGAYLPSPHATVFPARSQVADAPAEDEVRTTTSPQTGLIAVIAGAPFSSGGGPPSTSAGAGVLPGATSVGTPSRSAKKASEPSLFLTEPATVSAGLAPSGSASGAGWPGDDDESESEAKEALLSTVPNSSSTPRRDETRSSASTPSHPPSQLAGSGRKAPSLSPPTR